MSINRVKCNNVHTQFNNIFLLYFLQGIRALVRDIGERKNHTHSCLNFLATIFHHFLLLLMLRENQHHHRVPYLPPTKPQSTTPVADLAYQKLHHFRPELIMCQGLILFWPILQQRSCSRSTCLLFPRLPIHFQVSYWFSGIETIHF